MDNAEAIKRVKKLITNMTVSLNRTTKGYWTDKVIRTSKNLETYEYILKVLEGEIHV